MGYKFEKEDCSDCGGSGRTYGSSQKCHHCGGKGWVNGLFGGEKTCSKCDGDGNLYKKERCSSCGGNGHAVIRVDYCDECGKKNCWCGNEDI